MQPVPVQRSSTRRVVGGEGGEFPPSRVPFCMRAARCVV